MPDLPTTIADAAAALRARELSARELTEALLARARAAQPALGAFIAFMGEPASAAARQADADFARGADRGPLQGIPLGIKDIITTREGPTTGQSLVHDRTAMSGDADSLALVRTIVQLAESLSLRTVAEGVETAAQYDALRALGCDKVQGFYVSRPAPVGDAVAVADSTRPWHVVPALPTQR